MQPKSDCATKRSPALLSTHGVVDVVCSVGEILTKEFEELYEARELGEELAADCDHDTLEEFSTVCFLDALR